MTLKRLMGREVAKEELAGLGRATNNLESEPSKMKPMPQLQACSTQWTKILWIDMEGVQGEEGLGKKTSLSVLAIQAEKSEK